MTQDLQTQLTELEEKVELLGQAVGDGTQDQLQLANELLKTVQAVNDIRAVLDGLMVVLDSAMTMNKIHHQRLMALEQRAQGLSFEDLVDGKQLLPLGPTEEHAAALEAVNAKFQRMAERLDESTGE